MDCTQKTPNAETRAAMAEADVIRLGIFAKIQRVAARIDETEGVFRRTEEGLMGQIYGRADQLRNSSLRGSGADVLEGASFLIVHVVDLLMKQGISGQELDLAVQKRLVEWTDYVDSKTAAYAAEHGIDEACPPKSSSTCIDFDVNAKPVL